MEKSSENLFDNTASTSLNLEKTHSTVDPKTEKKLSIKPLYLGIVVGVLFTSFISLISFAYFSPKSTPVSLVTPSPIVSPTASMVTNTPPTVTPAPVVIEGMNLGNPTWLGFPKVIKPMSVLSDHGQSCAKNVSFQQTATFADGAKLINLIFTDTCGMGESSALYRLVQLPNNSTYLLVKNNDSMEYYGQYFLPSLKYLNISISGIDPPSTLEIKTGKFVLANYFMDNTISFTQISNPKLVEDTTYGSLYVSYTNNSQESSSGKIGMVTRSTYLRLKDDTVVSYSIISGFISDDQIPRVKWSDGASNPDQFGSAPKDKCGGNSNDVLKPESVYLQNLVESGVAATGQKVYKINDPNNLVIKTIYEQYSTMGYDPENKAKISLTDFLNKNSHILWQDGLKDWHLLVNNNYAPAVECGKPVIYLYPPQDTEVTVKVAANITKSEPTYPKSGWTVLAHPSGQLDYQNSTYPNLFWEGTGHGVYPSISGQGFVVKKSDLLSTIKNHLSQLGLNQQENSDFMDFWTDKLPATPYTRLTWITNNGMNQLAPLSVSPQPNTVIRVFLDFEGLNYPIKLTPQTLSAPKRQGFTLVEWGGLLVGKQ